VAEHVDRGRDLLVPEADLDAEEGDAGDDHP
jgi:hypothetical protein